MSMREEAPRWAHTALIELARQGREHPEITYAGAWDTIISDAEDKAEAEGQHYVYENHVVLAMQTAKSEANGHG